MTSVFLCESEMKEEIPNISTPVPLLLEAKHSFLGIALCPSHHQTPPQGAANISAQREWMKPPVITDLRLQEVSSKKH